MSTLRIFYISKDNTHTSYHCSHIFLLLGCYITSNNNKEKSNDYNDVVYDYAPVTSSPPPYDTLDYDIAREPDYEPRQVLQEAAIMGQFHHPNIIKLHGVVTVGEPVSW